MRAPLSWLRDFADFPDDIALLRATLDDLGLVVEDVEIVGEGLADVVVARIDEISAIEGADKVRRVMVEAGQGPLEIVCGATNFSLGDLVPLAPVGSVLPGGFAIAKRKMRGVSSNGMLCSGRELGIGDDHEGLLLLSEVEGAVPGAALTEVLGIEADVVFDVTVEGNRPDAWCIAGIARDLAARLGLGYSSPSAAAVVEEGPATADRLRAEIDEPELCSRLGLGLLDSVSVSDSPRWIQERLRLAGMRPINNVVDASNYVMLELGQPTHPYDLAKLAQPGLRVRRARSGERLTALDGVERELGRAGRGLGDTGEDCVICDLDDQVIGIAGIMGGASSEIDAETSTVLLEAAAFDPIAITRTSRRLALRTEASARFQKGSDPAAIEGAIRRFAELVQLSSPGARLAPEPLVVPPGPLGRDRLLLPIERVNSILGMSFSRDDLVGLLGPLGFEVAASDEANLTVVLPSNRPDIRRSERGIADLVEEVARSYGYSRLPRRFPSWATPGRPHPRQQLRTQLRELLCGVGASEAWTSSLVPAGEAALVGIDEPEIVITNPLTQDESRLRRTLLPGLLRSIGFNAERRQDDLALFEIGVAFVHPDAGLGERRGRAGSAGGAEVALPLEPELATVLLGREGDDATTAVALLMAATEALGLEGVRLDQAATPPGLHPSRSAIVLDSTTGERLGSVGEVDPGLVEQLAPGAARRRLGVLELELDALEDPSRATRRDSAAVLPSRFPSSDVDLAFAVPDATEASALLEALERGAGGLLEQIDLFDVYRGPGVADGSRSLAVRLRLCAEDRTLSEAELAEARSAMIEAAEALGATLR
jgi:phenylalanyl-tRNA synthetase beta chain